jgi:hypothetical protein
VSACIHTTQQTTLLVNIMVFNLIATKFGYDIWVPSGNIRDHIMTS